MHEAKKQVPAAADRKALESAQIVGTNGWEPLASAVHQYSKIRRNPQLGEAAERFGGWSTLGEMGAPDFKRARAWSSEDLTVLRQLITETDVVVSLIARAVVADTLLWMDLDKSGPDLGGVLEAKRLHEVLIWRCGALALMNRHEQTIQEAKLLLSLAWRSQSLHVAFVEHIGQLRLVAARNLAVLVREGVAGMEVLVWATSLAQREQLGSRFAYLHELAVTLEQIPDFALSLGIARSEDEDFGERDRHAAILVRSLPRLCKLVVELQITELDTRHPEDASRLLSLVTANMNISDTVSTGIQLSLEDAYVSSAVKLITASLVSEAALAVIDFARLDTGLVDRIDLARQVVSRRDGLDVESFGGELFLVPVAEHPATQFDPKWRVALRVV